MKKLVLMIIILSLFVFGTQAWEKTKLGNDLVIESLTINPIPVEPGESFDLTIKVRNSDLRRTMEQPTFSIQESFPFTLESKPKVLTSLKPNEESTITFRIKVDKNAVLGVNELGIEYEEKDSPKYTEQVKIDIRISAIEFSVASIETIPENIYPGDEAQIKLVLKNNLPIIMKNIDLKFELESESIPFTPIGTTSQRTMTILNKGDQKTFLFDIAVDADAEPKIYKTPLYIQYEDEFGNSYNINTTTGVKISTLPELQIAIEKTEIYQSRSSGKVIIRISNKGLADIKFLTLELQNSEDYDIFSTSQVYIGNVESDDYETAEFNIYVKSSDKKVPLKLLLSYRDAFNQEYKKEEIVYLPLYSYFKLSKFGLKETNGIIKLIFYIILVSFIYLSFREWRKTRDLPLALKKALRILLVKIKRIIKSFRLRTIKRAIKSTIRFFKEP